MADAGKSIGDKFERHLQELFPEWQFMDGKGESNIPDFWYPRGHFRVEAKAGNYGWGGRIKEYQVDKFPHDESVIYALGYHGFMNSQLRLSRKTSAQAQACLDKHLRFLRIAFISREMVDLLWGKEKKFPKSGKEPYFMLKNSIVNTLFSGRRFRRFEQQVFPESYWGFSYHDYRLYEQMNDGVLWRAMLRKNIDDPFLRFMRQRGYFSERAIKTS